MIKASQTFFLLSLIVLSVAISFAQNPSQKNLTSERSPNIIPNFLLSGNCYLDSNRNGVKDPGEPGISGKIILLSGILGVLQTTTDANGDYSFLSILGAGNYVLRESTATSGWIQTQPSSQSYNLVLTLLSTITGQDFGNFELGKINVEVTTDVNGNGLIDSGDNVSLPAGVYSSLNLHRDTINLSGTAGSNVLSYTFSNLDTGTYSIQQSLIPSGWIETRGSQIYRSIHLSGFRDTIRFMNFQLGQIGGRVFNDINRNGILDSGETGIGNRKIYFNDSLTHVLTDSLGYYTYSNVGPGNLSVFGTSEIGWLQTLPSSSSYILTPTSGIQLLNKNFGLFELGKIVIEATIDVNGDGTIDAADNLPLPSGTTATFTVQQGIFSVPGTAGNTTLRTTISGLDTGTYAIFQSTIPSGWIQTYGGPVARTISLGGFIDTIKFMDFKLASISGKVFEDIDGSGSLDVGEPGISNWRVFFGTSANYITTDSLGYYTINDVGPGTYTITDSTQNGWVRTSPNIGGHVLSILSGVTYSAKNFGNFKLGILSGIAFNDLNNNGNKDSGEPGLSGWKIKIRTNVASISTTTDSTGAYSFSSLPIGNYTIEDVSRAGWVRTFPASGIYLDTIVSSSHLVNTLHFGYYQLPNSISGMKFYDINGNGRKDSDDVGLSGWTIKLQNTTLNTIATRVTDSSGNYTFDSLASGAYFVKETQQNGWIQTYPKTTVAGVAPGIYSFLLTNGQSKTDVDFGNTFGCRYIGPPGGSWRDSANWSCGHPPTAEIDVTIPQDTTVYVPADFISDSIAGFRVERRAHLIFQQTNRRLRIRGSVQIDSGATLEFPDVADSTGLILYGDFINDGTFNSGKSTIVLSGDSSKTIVFGENASPSTIEAAKRKGVSDFNGNNFYNLVIEGENTNLVGNLSIENKLSLYNDLLPRIQDTVFINTSDTSAIDSNGLLRQGTIDRQISASGGKYRFESNESYLDFRAEDTHPTSISITAIPDTTPDGFSAAWVVVGGTVDTATNTIKVDSIGKFSRWVFGKPGTGFKKTVLSSPGTQFGTPEVNRIYFINATGGDDFKASLQLRFDNDELPEFTSKSDLQLLKGPVVADTAYQNWNMVSVPVTPEYGYDKSVLFPTAVSSAYSFDTTNGYIAQTTLSNGIGYWLKYSSNQLVGVLGDEIVENTVSLHAGWNMIGALTYPISTQTVSTNPEEILQSPFFGYHNGYEIADTLTPMYGYWIKASEPGSLTLNASSLIAAKSRSNLINTEDMNNLVIRDDAGNAQTLYFSFDSKLDIRRFVMPPVPPQGSFDARFGTQTMAVAAPSGQDETVIPITIQSAEFPLSVSWNSTKVNGSAVLLHNGIETPITGKGTIILNDRDARISLKFSKAAISELPKTYALYQNYPNPFNPQTEIKFDLPAGGLVTIKVYNVLGQVVEILEENNQRDAGQHLISFNGVHLSSGVYFYKVVVNENASSGKVLFSDIKKMMLVK